ncbi:protein POLLENLESS 3-LIKE 2 [Cynara cardunculus var. scolymus]|uniref:protein POLLENLESS 3-LIKE 2 n=1 Tax=Cynara cardunculus var. scolymus TaxID=59895 RepID=UPI000D62761E|nr:protein POLLENLESS 3-LIKE 2 [Cynara cardunculus var. scolymus]
MMQDMWNAPPGFRPTKSAPSSPAKPIGGGVLRTRSESFNLNSSRSESNSTRAESFHVTHKVPVGDSPYVRAKNVQLVEKDPERAIPLFWAAINAGDRVDSALKDMAIVMKQQNRAEEAIEAIKSLRRRCSDQAQESLDNILLDLYKRCGRLDDQIALLRHKLFLIQQGMAFNGKRTKTARSQGKKFQVSVEQEATRLLGNLGWALMQHNNYIEAEDAYRRALVIAPDNNKMCNLGICLMKQGRLGEAKDTLRLVKPAVVDGPRGVDSHLKAYERAQQMLRDLESETMNSGGDRVEQRKLFDAFLGSSALWQPQPCKEHNVSLPVSNATKTQDGYADENANSNILTNPKLLMVKKPVTVMGPVGNSNSLNIDAKPFYVSNLVKGSVGGENVGEGLKRTRSGNAATMAREKETGELEVVNKSRRKSGSPEKNCDWNEFLPDSKDFEEAIIAAVLGSSSEAEKVKLVEKMETGKVVERKIEKRLKVFQDITPSLSPRA